MKYEYLVGLKLVSTKSNVSLDQNPYPALIQKALEKYNEVSLNATYNPKYIEINQKNILPDQIIISLHSTMELSVVGKALRYFSQILVSYPEFDSCVDNGKLFKTFPISNLSNNTNIVIDPEKIDDLDFLKAIMEYTYKKTDSNSTTYRKKRIAMAQMKQIALECGILSIN